MSIEWSPAAKRKRARRRTAEERAWRLRSSEVSVSRLDGGVGDLPYRPERSSGEPA